MPELWETDVRVFLTLTGLARRHTEHCARLVTDKQLSEAVDQARAHYPQFSDQELTELASRVERYRNEAICHVALRVPPSRKIVSRDTTEDDLAKVVLECGHERTFRVKEFQRMARCRECLKMERTTVAQNVGSVSRKE